jgi:hypothetical protein
MMNYLQDYIIVLGAFLAVVIFSWVIDFVKNKYFNTIDKQEKYFLIILRIYWIILQPVIFIINRFNYVNIFFLIIFFVLATFIVFFIQVLRLIFNTQKNVIYQYFQNKTKVALYNFMFIFWGYIFIICIMFQSIMEVIRSVGATIPEIDKIYIGIEVIFFIVPIIGDFLFTLNKKICRKINNS